MRWTKEDKHYKGKQRLRFGDKKIKKRFCLFPKSDWNNGVTTYFWLETVWVVYEWTQGGIYQGPCGMDVVNDHWGKIGIATSYSNAVKEIWC